tara:strand:+ start:937 stop:1143 length:207 start_codon:yes stop_codon:yes gene_type:complete
VFPEFRIDTDDPLRFAILVSDIVKEKGAGLVDVGVKSKSGAPYILVISLKLITGSVNILRVIVADPEL